MLIAIGTCVLSVSHFETLKEKSKTVEWVSLPARVETLRAVKDRAEVEAIRYARGLRADELSAVHFVLDSAHAERLRRQWQHFGHVTDLRTVDCFDRNLSRGAHDLVLQVMAEHADTKVTVLLPRRGAGSVRRGGEAVAGAECGWCGRRPPSAAAAPSALAG